MVSIEIRPNNFNIGAQVGVLASYAIVVTYKLYLLDPPLSLKIGDQLEHL